MIIYPDFYKHSIYYLRGSISSVSLYWGSALQPFFDGVSFCSSGSHISNKTLSGIYCISSLSGKHSEVFVSYEALRSIWKVTTSFDDESLTVYV